MNTDKQILLLVDDKDNFLDYEKRDACHLGNGLHHRAFVVLLENSKDQVLLQKRKHKLWDGYWDTTAISHPLHLEDRDETYNEAGSRALKNEMGIENIALKKIGGFNYFVKHGENCENEYCAILNGNYDGKIEINSNCVYEYKWEHKDDFIKKCIENDKEFAPWAIFTGKFLYENK